MGRLQLLCRSWIRLRALFPGRSTRTSGGWDRLGCATAEAAFKRDAFWFPPPEASAVPHFPPVSHQFWISNCFFSVSLTETSRQRCPCDRVGDGFAQNQCLSLESDHQGVALKRSWDLTLNPVLPPGGASPLSSNSHGIINLSDTRAMTHDWSLRRKACVKLMI